MQPQAPNSNSLNARVPYTEVWHATVHEPYAAQHISINAIVLLNAWCTQFCYYFGLGSCVSFANISVHRYRHIVVCCSCFHGAVGDQRFQTGPAATKRVILARYNLLSANYRRSTVAIFLYFRRRVHLVYIKLCLRMMHGLSMLTSSHRSEPVPEATQQGIVFLDVWQGNFHW